MIDLPHFPYHRDPMASECLRTTDEACDCCGVKRGITYTGNTYCLSKPTTLCPWCIANGDAENKFDASFFDADFVDDDMNPVDLPPEIHSAVFGRTIGFATFNPIGWWVHCGEPAEYIRRDEPYDMIFECRKCGKQHTIMDFD